MSIWTEEHDDGETQNKRNKRHEKWRGSCFFLSGHGTLQVAQTNRAHCSTAHLVGRFHTFAGGLDRVATNNTKITRMVGVGEKVWGRVVCDALALILTFFLSSSAYGMALGGVCPRRRQRISKCMC